MCREASFTVLSKGLVGFFLVGGCCSSALFTPLLPLTSALASSFIRRRYNCVRDSGSSRVGLYDSLSRIRLLFFRESDILVKDGGSEAAGSNDWKSSNVSRGVCVSSPVILHSLPSGLVAQGLWWWLMMGATLREIRRTSISIPARPPKVLVS